MAGNRRREGAPWGGMNRNNNGQRAFHRTEASRPEGRENGPRGGKPRDWEQNRAAGQADREDSFRRGARPNNRRGAERPAGNPPRTGSFHPVPRAVFDGDTDTGSLMAGQVCGMLHEVRPAAAILEELWAGAQQRMAALQDLC